MKKFQLPWTRKTVEPIGPVDAAGMIPVTAEDVARRKRRVIAAWLLTAAVVALGAFWIHQRSTDPLKAQAALEAGRELMAAARYHEAILDFDRAIALQPRFADPWRMRARANVALYDPNAAIADFTQALRLEPHDSQTALQRGQAYLTVKNYPAAMADAATAIGIDPKLAAAYNVRGVAERETGDPAKALEDFGRAVELAPTAENFFQRGTTYQQVGEYARAIEDFTQTIAFQPTLAHAYYARAAAERAAGDTKRAELDHAQARFLDSH